MEGERPCGISVDRRKRLSLMGLTLILGCFLLLALSAVLLLPSQAAPAPEAPILPSAERAAAASVVAAQAGDGSMLSITDAVTHIVHLPLFMRNFDPEAVLPPGHVLIAEHPRITRLTELLGDDETRVSYFVRNNVGHPIERFSLTFMAEAAVGAVHPVSITTDQPDLFTLSQSDGPEVVTCTFTLGTDQALQMGQKVELVCTYREISGTIVVDSETIAPEPFVADEDYDQVNDYLTEQIEEILEGDQPDAPVPVIVMLTHPVTQSDQDLFASFDGTVEFTLEIIDGFFGTIPANRFDDYRAAAGSDLAFVDPDLEVAPALDTATANTRIQQVWGGALDGANTPDARFAYTGDPMTAIAIIDSGLDPTHPGLGNYQDVIVVGWRALAAGTKIVGWHDEDQLSATAPQDQDGHGSHVAGIAAGTGIGAPGGRELRGVAYDARLVGVRYPQSGNANAGIINGLNWLRNNLAAYHVVAVNQSLRQRDIPARTWGVATRRLVEAGVVVVNAAGNEFDNEQGGGLINTPATEPKVLTVGAVSDSDQVTWFSSNGDPLLRVTKPDVVAPGGGWVIDNNFIRTATMTSVDSNAPEPFIDNDSDGQFDGGDRCGDLNHNRQFDRYLDIYLELNAPPNWVRGGGEPFLNWNGRPGYQAGGDACLNTHNPGVNALSGELWFDRNWNSVHDTGGRNPGLNNFTEMNGTSQASPMVAGEVALIVDAMTDYENQNTDNEGGADEDRWDGVDNDKDDIIDEDPGQWVYDEQFARLVKSIVLMTTFEVPGGEAVPAQWLWFDENGDGLRNWGDELIRDVNGNNIYNAGVDAVIRNGANGLLDTPNGASFSPTDANPSRDPWFANAGASNDPRRRPGAPAGGWDRGGKDNKEGYGRIAPDAAIEAVTKEFCAVETDRFGNGLTDKKVWARHLHLYRGKEYKVILDGPAGADYDLYLYRGIPDANGEPVTVTKSTTPTANEAMTFTVPADGLYFLVVRRVTGAGEFTVRLITPEEWTIMVYMPAELEGAANLDELAFQAINDMEQTGSGEESMKDFQVLVQVDYDVRAYDGRADHQGHAVRYCIRKDHVITGSQYSIVKPIITAAGVVTEVNMGITQTLAQFVDWAVDYFPAKKYALIIWGDGRGYGWKVNPDKALGPGNDVTPTLDALTMQELREGMAAVKTEINGGSDYKDGTGVDKNVDILGFDMGHMALIEVGRQVQDSVEVMVASQERITDTGWPYKEVLDGLKDNARNWDAEAFSKHIVSVYHTYYMTDTKHTLSAVRLNPKPGDGGLAANDDNRFTELVQQTSKFADEMRTVIEEPDRGTCEDKHDKVEDNVQYHIKHSGRLNVQEFEDHNYIDLQHFAYLIHHSPICTDDITADIEVISLTQKAGPVVLAEEHGPARPNAHGLSIYFPRDQLLPEDKCEEAPAKGDRTCGFDNPFPSKVLYAKDPTILAPILRQPPDSDTHPRPQIEGFLFPEGTTWDEFLHRYYKPVADACVRWQGDCLKAVTVTVGTQVQLSGFGSSDSDGPNQDDIPQQWYWDKDLTTDNPALIPIYPITSNVPIDPVCSEDCDRDAADETNDDPDLSGRVVTWTCPATGIYNFRLMTHDEHNDQNRVHDEETHHVHWKLDDDQATVICIWWWPIKTPDPVTTTPGELVDYTVELTNDSTVEISFQATDMLPVSMTLQTESLSCPNGQCSFNPSLNQIDWLITLSPGASGELDYTVEITETIPLTYPYELVNRITVTDSLGYVQEASSTITVTCAEADLSVTKSDQPDPVLPGGELVYTLVVSNAGPSDAAGVVVTDTLPDGVTFVSALPPDMCTVQGNIVTCNLGNLPKGESRTITITVLVSSSAEGTLINTAQVTSETTDLDEDNNTATEDTTVCPIIVDLGTLPGHTQSEAYGVNDNGQVAGTSVDPEWFFRGFLWSSGEMTNLGTLPGHMESEARDVNNAGQVVGLSTAPDWTSRAFLWEDGEMTNLGTLPGHISSRGHAIDNIGQVVGNSYAPDWKPHAFLWSEGEMIDLGTLPGHTQSAAFDINDAGQVVGDSTDAEGMSHAFLWSDGEMIDLGTLPGHIQSEAYGINNHGQVVGRSVDADWIAHAFLWSAGEMADLGANWTAYSINDHGQVVGTKMDPGSEIPTAVLWEDGVLTDLNDLLPPDSGWQLLEARDINNNGGVVGWGLHNDEWHAYYLALSSSACLPGEYSACATHPSDHGRGDRLSYLSGKHFEMW